MASHHKGISKTARALLSSGETKLVDYKERIKGLHSEDLVAFANSSEGGTILIGICESTSKDGRQIGIPIGHAVDNDTRLQIMAKALSCSPPVQIEIILENLNSKPFFRIEIPSGAHKPYATNSGTYKIREDGRNNPILPEQLLKMFLEREGKEFSARFTEATALLDKKMAAALTGVQNLEDIISTKIEQIGQDLGWAEYKTSETVDTIESVLAHVGALRREADKQTQRLRAIIAKVAADDPVKKKAEEEFKRAVLDEIKKSPEFFESAKKNGKFSMELKGEAAAEIDQEAAQRLFSEVLTELLNEHKKKTPD